MISFIYSFTYFNYYSLFTILIQKKKKKNLKLTLESKNNFLLTSKTLYILRTVITVVYHSHRLKVVRWHI